MNKKLLAVAVLGALAVPAAAFAQPKGPVLTISGKFHGGFESTGGYTRATGATSQYGIVDDSSRIIFSADQDLGGGLRGIGQFDFRPKLDDTQGGTPTSGIGGNLAAGNTHVGIRSPAIGRLLIGRQDMHYGGRESELTVIGSLRADSVSILCFVGGGSTGQVAIAGCTRTQNAVYWTSPNWGGLTVNAGYSSNAKNTDSDFGSTIRKGRAFNVNPVFTSGNIVAGYSYWNGRDDGGIAGNTVATGDQIGHRLFASYRFGAFKVGAAYDMSEVEGATNGTKLADRSAWSLPVSFTFGQNQIHAHLTQADDDDAIAGDQKARMMAVAFVHNFSAQTAVALTWAQIKNNADGAYSFFTGSSLGISPASAAGDDPRLIGVQLRQSF